MLQLKLSVLCLNVQNRQSINLVLNEPELTCALTMSSPHQRRNKASASKKVCVLTELIHQKNAYVFFLRKPPMSLQQASKMQTQCFKF